MTSAARILSRLQRFHGLAVEFRRAAQHGDSAGLERILVERRRLVEELDQADPPATESDRTARARLLESILEIDQGTEEILQRQRDEIGAELVAMGSGRRGLAGYGAGGRSAGKRIDERG
ncbi:MAG: hypothetical protein DHS20C21_20960 [Gemmatimonadota bacterium]|nr:MAG: hypothetical protein DHS20C21_20960 [Gemmatimonadota bacterium]